MRQRISERIEDGQNTNQNLSTINQVLEEHDTNFSDHRPNLRRLFPVKQGPKQPGYEWLTESSLRHWIFNAPEAIGSNGTEISGNGFGKSIIRIGRKILIDLDELDIWVESNRLS